MSNSDQDENSPADSSSWLRPSSHEHETQTQKQACKEETIRERLSLTQMTTKNWSFESDIQAVQKLALSQIGLWRWKCEDRGEETSEHLVKHAGLKVSSLSCVGGFTGANGYAFDDSMDEAIEILRFAEMIGARTLLVSPGESAGHIQSHANRLAIESLFKLGDNAMCRDVDLAIMPMSAATAHGWTFLTSLHRTLEVLEQCDHPYVGVCVHSYYALQERNWRDHLKAMLPRLKLVRISDGQHARKPRQQMLPFSGGMKLVEFIEFLETHGYQGTYEVDVWADDVWQLESLDPFQEVLSRMEEVISGSN